MSAKPSPPKNLPAKDDLRGILAWHVRTLRVERGWSQERLALTCDLDRTYVSALERRVWNVSLSNIEKIATALDTEPWRLLVPVSPHQPGDPGHDSAREVGITAG